MYMKRLLLMNLQKEELHLQDSKVLWLIMKKKFLMLDLGQI